MTIKAKVELYWTDPRLSGFPEDAKIPEDIWRPELMGCDGFSLIGLEDYSAVPTFDMTPTVRQNGLLKLCGQMVLSGDGMNISEDFSRMRMFLFDGVRIDLSISPFGNRRRENSQHVKFGFSRPNKPDRVNEAGAVLASTPMYTSPIRRRPTVDVERDAIAER